MFSLRYIAEVQLAFKHLSPAGRVKNTFRYFEASEQKKRKKKKDVKIGPVNE